MDNSAPSTVLVVIREFATRALTQAGRACKAENEGSDESGMLSRLSVCQLLSGVLTAEERRVRGGATVPVLIDRRLPDDQS